MAVVDSRFRVHGVEGLRVVDASVFPRIPGFFIVTPVYMVSEKASDVILEDAGLGGGLGSMVRRGAGRLARSVARVAGSGLAAGARMLRR
jgi:choline dehydrogenase-like flavoprotein